MDLGGSAWEWGVPVASSLTIQAYVLTTGKVSPVTANRRFYALETRLDVFGDACIFGMKGMVRILGCSRVNRVLGWIYPSRNQSTRHNIMLGFRIY